MTDHISAGSFGCNCTLAVNSKGGFVGHLIKKPPAGLAAAGSVSLVSASESLLTPMCSCSSSLGKRENLSKSQRRKKRLDLFWLGFCMLTEMNQLWPGIGCAYWPDTHRHTHTHPFVPGGCNQYLWKLLDWERGVSAGQKLERSNTWKSARVFGFKVISRSSCQM